MTKHHAKGVGGNSFSRLTQTHSQTKARASLPTSAQERTNTSPSARTTMTPPTTSPSFVVVVVALAALLLVASPKQTQAFAVRQGQRSLSSSSTSSSWLASSVEDDISSAYTSLSFLSPGTPSHSQSMNHPQQDAVVNHDEHHHHHHTTPSSSSQHSNHQRQHIQYPGYRDVMFFAGGMAENHHTRVHKNSEAAAITQAALMMDMFYSQGTKVVPQETVGFEDDGPLLTMEEQQPQLPSHEQQVPRRKVPCGQDTRYTRYVYNGRGVFE